MRKHPRTTQIFPLIALFAIASCAVGESASDGDGGMPPTADATVDAGSRDGSGAESTVVNNDAAGADATTFDGAALDSGEPDVGRVESDAGAHDASTDTSIADTGTDSGEDANRDSGFDGGHDSGYDAQVDSGADAGADAGPDSGRVRDAGYDAGYDAGHDAGYDSGSDAGFDAGLDSGFDAGTDSGMDAGEDSGLDAGADAAIDSGGLGTDSGTDGGLDAAVDAAVDASLDARYDASDAAVCITVATPSLDAGTNPNSCPFSGVCTPGITSYSSLAAVAPTEQQVCTLAQMQAFYTNCLNASGISGCDTYMSGSGTAEEACGVCLFSDRATATTYGPVIYQLVTTGGSSNEYFLSANIGGCVDLFEPCNEGCAAILQQTDDCQTEACNTVSCATTPSDYPTCQTDSLDCACYDYEQATLACTNEFNASPHPAAGCFNMWGSETMFTTTAKPFCWNGK